MLSSPQNSSATFGFIDTVSRRGLARIYGQPTGGNQRGINGGSFFFLGLPNSKIELDVPLIGTFPPEPMPDAGLTPDILIKRKQRDVEDARDAALDAVGERVKPKGIIPSPRWPRR